MNRREVWAVVVLVSLLIVGEMTLWFYRVFNPPKVYKVESANEKVVNETKAKININTATLEELMQLPGVGEKTARRIIEGRPYRSVDELLKVKGIGRKKLQKLKPFISIK